MSKISEKEVIERAQEYITHMQKEIKENKYEFVECNKKAISDFEELQGYMSLYKFGAPKYKLIAYEYIKQIFG